MDAPSRKPGRPRDEELVARRREEILDIATQFFARQGFQRTDVQAVADSLGLGKGTIYRYFPTKERLFLASVDRGLQLLHTYVEDRVAGAGEDPLGQFVAAVMAYLAYFDTHPDLIELLIQERAEFRDRKKPTYFEHRDTNIGRWRVVFEQLIERGVVRDVEVDRILNVVTDLLYGTIFTNYFSRPTRSLEAQASEILDIVLNGVLLERQEASRD